MPTTSFHHGDGCDDPLQPLEHICPACEARFGIVFGNAVICPDCGWTDCGPWTCKTCGRENHAGVTTCPGCLAENHNLETKAICGVLSVIAKDGDKIIEAVRDMGKQERGTI